MKLKRNILVLLLDSVGPVFEELDYPSMLSPSHTGADGLGRFRYLQKIALFQFSVRPKMKTLNIRLIFLSTSLWNAWPSLAVHVPCTTIKTCIRISEHEDKTSSYFFSSKYFDWISYGPRKTIQRSSTIWQINNGTRHVDELQWLRECKCLISFKSAGTKISSTAHYGGGGGAKNQFLHVLATTPSAQQPLTKPVSILQEWNTSLNNSLF